MPRQLTLTLDGQPVDLPANTTGLVKLTQARNALSDLAARQGEFSWPLTLPATRRNAQVLGVDKLHPLALDKFARTDYAYELRCGGEVFSGTFRLSALKRSAGYTGQLLGEGFSWALELGDKTLPQLGFTPVAYDGSQLETILAKGCDETDVQFPLVSYGNFFAPPVPMLQPDGTQKDESLPASAALSYPLSVEDCPPAVYLVNILRQIFTGIGYHLQGRVLEEAFWRQVVMLPAGATLDTAWPWGALLPASGTTQVTGTDSFSYYGGGPRNDYSNNAVGFYTLPDDGAALSGDVFFLPVPLNVVTKRPIRVLDLPTATYTARLSGVYDFTWSMTLASGQQVFDGPNMNSGDYFVTELMRPLGLGLVIVRSGQDFTSADGGLCTGDPASQAMGYTPGQDRVLNPQRLDVPGGPVSALALGLRQGTSQGVYLDAGDTVTLCVFGRRSVFDGSNNLTGYRKEFTLHFSAVSLSCTAYADDDGTPGATQLQPAAFLPPLAQVDVVKDFLTRTNTVLVADAARRVASLLSREELAAATGPALDLTDRCDPDAAESSPALGAGVGQLVFSPATSNDDPLTPTGTDVVTITVGTGATAQQVGSQFAPVAFRAYDIAGSASYQRPREPLPTCATADTLKQPLAEVAWDISAQPPRLLRYTGADSNVEVPFLERYVPLARSAWDGPLAWDGASGAVNRYYADTLLRARRGHLLKVPAAITPAHYRQLVPGRRVLLFGALYSVETVNQFDPAADAALTQLELTREAL